MSTLPCQCIGVPALVNSANSFLLWSYDPSNSDLIKKENHLHVQCNHKYPDLKLWCFSLYIISTHNIEECSSFSLIFNDLAMFHASKMAGTIDCSSE